MADNGGETLRGSEMADDFLCVPCLKSNKHVDSVKYCVECKEYMCKTCLSYHERFTPTKNHNVIMKSKVVETVESLRSVDIWFYSDSCVPCDVQGVCVVTRGNEHFVIFTDWENKTIKVLDMKSERIFCAVKLKHKPYGVCEMPSSGIIVATLRDTDELAVLEFDGSSLTFINIASHTQLNVKVPTHSRGVTVFRNSSSDNLLVLNGGNLKRDGKRAAVSVFSTQFKTLAGTDLSYPIYLYSEMIDTSFRGCFPKNIAIGKNQEIFITDESIGVIEIDLKGKEKRIIQNELLKGARGICTDKIGNLYVSGLKSNNVVKFSSDGQFLGEVVNASDGLECPLSLCFFDEYQILLIGCLGLRPFLIAYLQKHPK